jgi:uncharacterized protein GlcG (DUF336 family)
MNHLQRTSSSIVKNFVTFCGLILSVICAANPVFAQQQILTVDDVQAIISQAVSTAVSLNQKVTVAVTDHEGNVVGVFAMTGAPGTTLIRSVGANMKGLEGQSVPSAFAAISKAGTGSLFGTSGNAFTTRTAGFIIQEHFPPGIDNRPGGPLYGVQFSSFLCSDVAVAGLPLGLSADPGGVPLYKNGIAVGGVGIEGDGLYTVDRDPRDEDQPFEEIIAISASQNYAAPPLIRGDNILVEGIRFPYSNVDEPLAVTPMPFASLPGVVSVSIRATRPSAFMPMTLNGVSGEVPIKFPIIAGSALSAAEVTQILGQAAFTANITRAGIRQPLGSNARVSISVVDVDGKILGIFRQADAPVFGYDVSAQKARTAAFLARSDAGAQLRAAGLGSYVDRAAADGIRLDGSIAFSDRGFGFLHRPLFPDGINDTDAGPFSSFLEEWSPFNVGLQLDLINPITRLFPAGSIPPILKSRKSATKESGGGSTGCTPIPGLRNGMQIFAGGIPLYKGSTLVGAIGISGDGIDQDDFIAAGGGNNFAPPREMRSDRVFVRGARLPFIKIPARPTL